MLLSYNAGFMSKARGGYAFIPGISLRIRCRGGEG